MASTTVAQLAVELNRSAAALLEQLQSAGVSKGSTADSLTESDKERLLDHLRATHGTVPGAERKKITLTRKQTTEIKAAGSMGKARTIQVEVRKKRTFIKRDDTAPAAGEPTAPVIDDAELARLEEQAQAQAELLRRQEEDMAEQRRVRDEQAAREREAAEARAREIAETRATEAAAAALAAAQAPAGKRAAEVGAKKPAEAPAAPVAVEPVRPALRVIKAADVVDEEKQRAADLTKRRKAAEDEASAIRVMMNAPKKVLVAKKPEGSRRSARPGTHSRSGSRR